MSELTKEEQWQEYIAECKSSGLTINQWCEQKGITYSQYHYWQKKLNQDKDVQWASISVNPSSTNPQTTKSIILTMNQYQISIPDGFNPLSLAEVLKVVNTVC